MVKKLLITALAAASCVCILAGSAGCSIKDEEAALLANGNTYVGGAAALQASGLAVGDVVEFGSYPQTVVTDNDTITALDSLAGDPAEEDSSWSSYGYYLTENSIKSVSDYMKYLDVEYNDDTYRGVYFSEYRAYSTNRSSSAGYSNQDDNGYETGNIYWFKYEDVEWRVLEVEEENGQSYATLMCETIIDSQEYNYTTFETVVEGETYYANNYAYSSIRAWLNDTLYNTMFSDDEKARVQLTEIDNSTDTTGNDNNKYYCEDTEDYLWLISYQDAVNTTYFASDSDRQKLTSDYAQCQGAYTDDDGNGLWWLRSPRAGGANGACCVRFDGCIYNNKTETICCSEIRYTYCGVCPAVKIKL